MGQYETRRFDQPGSNDQLQSLRPRISRCVHARHDWRSFPSRAGMEEGFDQTSTWRNRHFRFDVVQLPVRLIRCQLDVE